MSGRPGISMNIEQQVNDNLGVFSRRAGRME